MISTWMFNLQVGGSPPPPAGGRRAVISRYAYINTYIIVYVIVTYNSNSV